MTPGAVSSKLAPFPRVGPPRERRAPAPVLWRFRRIPSPAETAAPGPGAPSSSELAALALVVGLGALLRLVAPGVFPEVLPDEGLWTNSTKNGLLFGDPFMDGRTHLLLSPLFHLACWPLFALFGPSIAAARVVSGLAGAAAVPLTYLLVLRLTGRRAPALAAALLFATDQSFVWAGRLAQVEAFQLVWLLGAAVALARPSRPGAALGGALFALALLAKTNSVFLLPVLGLWLAWPDDPRAGWLDRRALGRAVLFGAVAVGLAGLVYGALYRAEPERFVSAFQFELREEFDPSDAVVSASRFGLDPTKSARSIQALLSESPFLYVLASIGMAVAAFAGGRGPGLLVAWAAFGTAFVLLQVYQPGRYFHLNAPALAGCAALAVGALLPSAPHGARVRGAVLALVVAFNLGSLGMNAATNPARMLAETTAWARESLPAEARVIAAGYLCTDLPQRAYAWYHLARTPEELLAAVDAYDVDYVLYDHEEWPPDWLPALDAAFTRVAEWPFGVAYRVRPAP